MIYSYNEQVQVDFDRARTREVFAKIFALLKNEKDELLAFDDIKSILKPKSTTYKGTFPVEISLIVGSEGRYKDFNKRFLPRYQHLRRRWQRVDMAHHQNKILPAVKLYEIGGVYFVRDGNHRVSVAKMQGAAFIDAEVISLDTEITITPEMGRKDLSNAVIAFEKERFFEATHLDVLRPECSIEFTSIGRYDDIIKHINGHKYFINIDQEEEIPFGKAMLSWYDNVFIPIITIITKENILNRFPERTPADLYVWIVRHWHELKERYGHDFSLKQAVLDFSQKYGKSFFDQIKEILRRIGFKIMKRKR
ncbi:MAG: transcriptional regulator [Spirochaetales bacterium]|nr:transcriptional regulator [Spirochaetales bacterium]